MTHCIAANKIISYHKIRIVNVRSKFSYQGNNRLDGNGLSFLKNISIKVTFK